MTDKTMITGFPRIGEDRELKFALERYWGAKSSQKELEEEAKDLRKKHWLLQKEAGISFISSNDFSYYDLMLDTAVMVGAIPERFRAIADPLEQYFSMARGNNDALAMEMTKWFNTNYHYIVPELDGAISFKLNASKVLSEYCEAKALGIRTKINLIGPITFLSLSRSVDGGDPLSLFHALLPVYVELLQSIAALDESVTVQIDEPILVRDPSPDVLALVKEAYTTLGSVNSNLRIVVMTYFEHACEAVKVLADTTVWGIGLDFVYGPENLDALSSLGDKVLVAGVVDGRNIWRNDLDATLTLLSRIAENYPKEKIIISTSSSLLHVPFSVESEPESEIRTWLSFGVEKVSEVSLLSRLFFKNERSKNDSAALLENRKVLEDKKDSRLLINPDLAMRVAHTNAFEREGAFEERIALQEELLGLPSLPTTTIGSFPQTPEIRKLRLDYKRGAISEDDYESGIKKEIDRCVAFQEKIGLDVLVHGEPERNDMVEYFGSLMQGFHFTQNGWVQSYGSRCVKPPVIYGDITRPEPMTLKWITYAQSKTEKVMKGMLTGPVTIINWSFVRNDIPRSAIATQIAFALADEIGDLQDAGIRIIQVDEAAFKEGYPLRKEKIPEYEKWALESFKLAVATAHKETQIHTHMCYSEFNDIIQTIENMDADVITIETARSGNRLLKVFNESGYTNEIGPGVYDIHSPRVPSVVEFTEQIKERLKVVDHSKMWVNPDCGLKTRKWNEVEAALSNMVEATLKLR